MEKRKKTEEAEATSVKTRGQSSKKPKKEEPPKLITPRCIDWKFFKKDKFCLKDLFEYQGWT